MPTGDPAGSSDVAGPAAQRAFDPERVAYGGASHEGTTASGPVSVPRAGTHRENVSWNGATAATADDTGTN